MSILRLIIAAAIGIAWGAPAGAQTGPFGFNWGTPFADASRGGQMTVTKREGQFTFVKTATVPSNLSIAETYSLIFHDEHGLQKVAMFSKDFKDDPFGTSGKRTFHTLKESLNEKYGKPSSGTETTGLKLYKDSDEFYQCLAYSGCGMWAALWEPKTGGSIALEIKGGRRGQGFVVLTYEGPEWESAIDAHRSNASSKDKNAL